MKLYDFDGMFDEKLTEYVAKNRGKYTEEQLEDLVPKLYKKFGETFISAVGDTPNGFFKKLTNEQLIFALTLHLKKGVPISGFMRAELESRPIKDLLIPLLDGTEKEREIAMELLGAEDGVIKKYLELLVNSDDEDFKNACVEYIKEKADLVTADALKYYKEGKDKELMLEIMSRSVIRCDEVFNTLLTAFRCDGENLPLHASYLAAYGDERALPYLMDRIEGEVTFPEFRELKFAIESLGGEYEKERDFSDDGDYQKIKESGPADIFGGTGGV